MKYNTTNKLFAFIVVMMMFFAVPQISNAQSSENRGRYCGPCYSWYKGKCVPCRGCCGWKANSRPPNETSSTLTNIYYSGSQSAIISFSMEQAEKFSVKIFDMTGRLIKILADKIFEQGEHNLLWDAAGINAGIYIVQFKTVSYSEAKKIAVIK